MCVYSMIFIIQGYKSYKNFFQVHKILNPRMMIGQQDSFILNE
jgi:hypothetical protein